MMRAGQFSELEDRPGFELFYKPHLVGIDRLVANQQAVGNVLVVEPARYITQDFELALRQVAQAQVLVRQAILVDALREALIA
jgi:hypothetical protein